MLYCMNKKFDVSVLPRDRRLNNAFYFEAETANKVFDSFHRSIPRRLVAYDPALAHILPAHFELRLDECNNLRINLQTCQYCRKNLL